MKYLKWLGLLSVTFDCMLEIWLWCKKLSEVIIAFHKHDTKNSEGTRDTVGY